MATPPVFNLPVSKVTVLTGHGATDQVTFHIDTGSPFPAMGYQTSLKVEAQRGYGHRWVRDVLQVPPEMIEVLDVTPRPR